jgi:arsenate reductase (thioredoxin)
MKNVMFVCKRNSCRSQMAEGFARNLGAGVITIKSSGLQSSHVNATAVEVMKEIGIDISGQTSDPLSDFGSEDFDIVISLCGCGVNLPEAWLIRETFEDWQLEDPDGKSLEIFHRVRDEIKERVQNLVNTVKAQSPVFS